MSAQPIRLKQSNRTQRISTLGIHAGATLRLALILWAFLRLHSSVVGRSSWCAYHPAGPNGKHWLVATYRSGVAFDVDQRQSIFISPGDVQIGTGPCSQCTDLVTKPENLSWPNRCYWQLRPLMQEAGFGVNEYFTAYPRAVPGGPSARAT